MISKCDHEYRSIVDTRRCEGYTRRRCKCLDCKVPFSTIEVEVKMHGGKSAMESFREQMMLPNNSEEIQATLAKLYELIGVTK